MTIQITFMRHGYSRADDEMVHEGRYDSPLTELGRSQVRARADAWKRAGVTFEAIIASTLIRAVETAQIVGETLGVPVERDPIWMERDNGPLAGLPFDEAKERFPAPKFRNPYQPFVVSANEGESDWDLYARSALAVQSVVRRGPGSYLVVAHGGVLGGAMYAILGTAISGKGPGVSFAFGDTGYVETTYDPDVGTWTIRNMILRTPDELGQTDCSMTSLRNTQSFTGDTMTTMQMSRPVDILLVEDNPDDVALTREALRESDISHTLHVAADGVEALDFLRNRGEASPPDLVLLDLNLPKMDGKQVLREIKSDDRLKHIPVVVLTTSQADEDVLTSYQLHANCYVPKPVDFDEFVGVVRAIRDFWFGIVKLPPAKTI